MYKPDAASVLPSTLKLLDIDQLEGHLANLQRDSSRRTSELKQNQTIKSLADDLEKSTPWIEDALAAYATLLRLSYAEKIYKRAVTVNFGAQGLPGYTISIDGDSGSINFTKK